MIINFKKIIIFLCVTLFGLNSYSDGLSCDLNIDCDRFDYISMDRFSQSVIDYSEKHYLNSPSYALYKLNNLTSVKVSSLTDGLALVKENPGLIYSIGRYIKNNNKPREWQYIFEQSFIRSFNSLKR